MFAPERSSTCSFPSVFPPAMVLPPIARIKRMSVPFRFPVSVSSVRESISSSVSLSFNVPASSTCTVFCAKATDTDSNIHTNAMKPLKFPLVNSFCFITQ